MLGISLPLSQHLDEPSLGESLHIVTPCIFCITDDGSVWYGSFTYLQVNDTL